MENTLQRSKLAMKIKAGELEKLAEEFNDGTNQELREVSDKSSGGGGGVIAAARGVERTPIYKLAVTMFPGDLDKEVTTLLNVVFGKGERSFIRAEAARKLKCDFVRCEKQAVRFIGYNETEPGDVSYVTKCCDLSWRLLYGSTDYQEKVCVMPEMLAGCDLVLGVRFFNLGDGERTKCRYQVKPFTNTFNKYQNIVTTVVGRLIGDEDDNDFEDEAVHIQNPALELTKYLGVSECYAHLGDTEGQGFLVIAVDNSPDNFVSEKVASVVGSLLCNTRAELTLISHSGEKKVLPITKKWKCYWRMGEISFSKELFVMPGLTGCDIFLRKDDAWERDVDINQCTIISLLNDDDAGEDPSLSVQGLMRTYADMTFAVEYDEGFSDTLP